MNQTSVLEAVGVGKKVDRSAAGLPPLDILHEVSFGVAAGESVAIVGASGSGKSTLLGLMAGLDVPTSGEIRLDGRSWASFDEDGRAIWRAKSLGFVFQSFQLLPSLTALENVAIPLELSGRGDAESTARLWLERVGLAARMHHQPKHLSGGEQQRVALARAFAPSPKIVLADEPTGNLDANTGQQIIDLMFALNAAQGTTLILVTHDDALAAKCQRVLRMSEGRLHEAA